MAANRRTPIEIERDRTKVARMYLQGKTQYEIAAEMGFAVSQIAYDLKMIRKEWQESRFADLDQIKAEQLAKIDELERTAMNSFMQSLLPREVTITEKESMGLDQSGKPLPGPMRASTRKESQVGDPRFLEIVFKCIDRRCRLFGFDAPVKMDIQTIDALIEAELAQRAGEKKPENPDEPATDLIC